MQAPNDTTRPTAIGRYLAILAWPAALWGVAFFFHLGMTGPRSDDWFFDFTNPVSGDPHRLLISTWSTTHYRPLHHMYVPFISTAFADAWWIAVLLASLGHALAAAMLYRVLRALAIARPAAATGATLWMLYPVLFEVPLWVAAASTGIAAAIALGIIELTLRFLRTGSLGILPILAVGAYACCAFNEQPASMFAAMPLLALAARNRTWKQVAWRVPAATLAASVGVGIYLALMFGVVPFIAEGQPGHERGSASRLVTSLAELETRWNTTKDAANDIMWMPGMFRAGLNNGLSTLALGPRHAGWGWTIPWLLAIAAGAWCSSRAWLRSTHDRDPDPTSTSSRAAQLLIGIAIFFAGFVPVLVIRDQAMYTRLAYVPAIGLAIGFAAVLDAACTLGTWRQRTRTLAALAVFLAIVPASWALATLGIQDGLFPGATTIAWAAPEWARQAYGRWDIWAAPAWYHFKGPVVDATDAGIRLDPAMLDNLHQAPGTEGEPHLIPWSRAITVAIDESGSVQLVTAFGVAGRIVRHPAFEATSGTTIAIPVKPGP